MTDTITLKREVVQEWQNKCVVLIGDSMQDNIWISEMRSEIEAALAAPQPEPLSMSKFASRADYEEALKDQPQPICPACHGPGLLYECVWCSAKNYPPEPQPKGLFVDMIAEHGLEFGEDMPEPQPVKQALPYPTDAQLAQYLRDNACGGSNYNRVLNHAADVLEGAKP